MRNVMCRFCLIRCNKINEQIWKCRHCGGEYHIELFEEPKFNFIIFEDIKVLARRKLGTDDTLPAQMFTVIVDLMRDKTEIWLQRESGREIELTLDYTIPFEHHCRTITEARSIYYFNKEPKKYNRNYELGHWVEYQLQMQWKKDTGLTELKCPICDGYCINTTPKVSIYWECKQCDVHYYFSETPPFPITSAHFSFPRNNDTYWRIVLDYRKKQTTVSYEEDKGHNDVLTLDYLPELNSKFNARNWIQKKFKLYMVFS